MQIVAEFLASSEPYRNAPQRLLRPGRLYLIDIRIGILNRTISRDQGWVAVFSHRWRELPEYCPMHLPSALLHL